MDKKTQSLVRESINEKKEEVIRQFHFLLNYPFHPEATFILLEVRGDTGSFGISVTQMNGWGKQLNKNAYGKYDSDLVGFVFDVYANLEQDYNEIINDLELVDEIDDYAKEYFVPFIQECFNQAGGKNAKIPFYLYYPNSGDAYDLVKEKWLDEDEYL
ncbi:hypothetical protein [Thermoactinomyces mirandus]|uniref:DUF4303 domain-containing protein n=1 Tax=Thermoactinomyces mirandus TaxID=2756294 RepID=A0A7W1XR28_9BACL|nr:hypothetical protein [Thermoactinomyces mirandus]MBA4601723.1 hypothetical protein [Thermoactinomyces mirandus]